MFTLLPWAWLAYARGVRLERWSGLAALAVFLLWFVLGHGGNMLGQPVDVREEVLNVGAKTLLGISCVAGTLATSRPRLIAELKHVQLALDDLKRAGHVVDRRLDAERVGTGGQD